MSWKNGGRLRGCLGTLQPVALQTELAHYAIKSATHDGRFTPIQRTELEELTVHVSLLHDFQPVADWRADWEPGEHGIMISRGCRVFATFLPHVAEEQGWSRQETMEHLLQKGGLDAKIECLADLVIQRYRTRTESLHHSEK